MLFCCVFRSMPLSLYDCSNRGNLLSATWCMPDRLALDKSTTPLCVVRPWERCIVMAVLGRKGNCFRVTMLEDTLRTILNDLSILWIETVKGMLFALFGNFHRIHFFPMFSFSNMIFTVSIWSFFIVKSYTSPDEPLYRPSVVSKFDDISTWVPFF